MVKSPFTKRETVLIFFNKTIFKKWKKKERENSEKKRKKKVSWFVSALSNSLNVLLPSDLGWVHAAMAKQILSPTA